MYFIIQMEDQPKEETKQEETKQEQTNPEEKKEEEKKEEENQKDNLEENKDKEIENQDEQIDKEKVVENNENQDNKISTEEKKEEQNIDEEKEKAQKEKKEEQNIDEDKEKEEKEKKEKEKEEKEIKEKEEKEKEKKEKEEKEKKEKEEKEKEEKEKKNFEKNLWNQYEFLHKRYRTKIECFENILDIFNRVLNSLKDQHKVLNTIISKNFTLFPGTDYTQAAGINMIKKQIENKFRQLTSDIDLLKKNLIEHFKKHIDDVKNLEKNSYNQFIKLMSKYADSKNLLEKNKNKYHQSIKVAESSLKNSKSMKVKNIVNSQESQVTIQKLEDKAKSLLDEAKKNYDKYLTSLKDANKNREDTIEKQKQLINLYQSLEEKDGELLTNILKEIYNKQKEDNEGDKYFLGEMDSAIKAINIKRDKVNLINAYNSNEKPDEVIPLVQYQPQIDFEKGSSPEEYKINYEIIKAMKTSIPDLMPNFDIEKEDKKQEMRELSKKIFVTNIPFTEEEKNKLMEFLTTKWSQTYFLIYLSKQRTQGRFSRSQKLVKDLAEILNLILKSAEKENDYTAAKNCMILSQTYYYDEKDKDGNTKKKYLLDYILEYKWLRTPEFWRGIIDKMTVDEAHKYMKLNPKEPSVFDKDKKECIERLSNICFSQLLPYANNMKEFFVDDRLIVKIIDEFVEKYQIQKELADSIYSGVISEKTEEVEKLRKEYQDNPNFENELKSLEEVKKLHGAS